MANTFTQIYIHAVFAVQDRMSLITPGRKEEVHKYITGIVTNLGQKLLAIHCMPDHLHLLVGLKPALSISELIGKVKANSSGWINQKGWIQGRFAWQEGFGAFSYSHSQLPTVIRYIQNQEKHHGQRTFREEYVTLLKRFNLSYDEEYLFRPVE
jgi:putative transposase